METKSRNIAEEAAARTREIMEQAERKELPPAEGAHRPPKALLREGESFVRQHPGEALFGALSLGLLLSRLLPVRSLIKGVFRLGWMLFKPLALLYGGIKLSEWLRKESTGLPKRPIQRISEK